MSFITLGPKTQPDRMIQVTKKLSFNATVALDFAFMVCAICFEAVLVACLIDVLLRPFIPNLHVGMWTGLAFLGLIGIIRNTWNGVTTLVDMSAQHAQEKQPINVTINASQTNNTNTQSA